jgi:hypothetical protein
MKEIFEIKLVKPGIWQQVVRDAFSGLGSRVKAAAHSILRTMHNRHIGITPRLATELAPLIIDAYASRQGRSAWHDVLKRLQQETSDPLFSFGVMLSTIPAYSVIRLAMPILEEACQRINLCFLFCQDNIENDVTIETYNEYSRDLENEIKRMAGNKEDSLQLFWADRALTLATLSRRGNFPGPSASGLPETDPLALGLLLRLNPELSKTPPLSSHSRQLTDPLKHREASRMKEGGFSGIQVTRRLEDMEDILLSEFVNPPAVLADRLVNNGFLSLRRQTRREQLRDVLIAGMMPLELKPKLGADFVKACWFDFIRRFGYMLAQSGRKRSEFRWLEGNQAGQVRSCYFLLQDLPDLAGPFKGHYDSSFRREFLMALGWLPQYLDTRYRFQPVPQYTSGPGHQPTKVEKGIKTGLESAKRWAFSVWRLQEENLQWMIHEPDKTNPSGSREKRLNIDGFAVVHLMLFLPADIRDQGKGISAAARLGALYSGFGLGNIPGRNVSITWVPKQITISKEWAFDCRGKGDSQAFFREKPTGKTSSHFIAGRLEEVWRNQLIKELRSI